MTTADLYAPRTLGLAIALGLASIPSAAAQSPAPRTPAPIPASKPASGPALAPTPAPASLPAPKPASGPAPAPAPASVPAPPPAPGPAPTPPAPSIQGKWGGPYGDGARRVIDFATEIPAPQIDGVTGRGSMEVARAADPAAPGARSTFTYRLKWEGPGRARLELTAGTGANTLTWHALVAGDEMTILHGADSPRPWLFHCKRGAVADPAAEPALDLDAPPGEGPAPKADGAIRSGQRAGGERR